MKTQLFFFGFFVVLALLMLFVGVHNAASGRFGWFLFDMGLVALNGWNAWTAFQRIKFLKRSDPSNESTNAS